MSVCHAHNNGVVVALLCCVVLHVQLYIYIYCFYHKLAPVYLEGCVVVISARLKGY